jgi:tRNA pseudouridine32 synthase / 23S rRNA pseudouridine746 synthase
MVVHRLDQATSGVVVFAKNEDALKHLHAQLRDKAADAAARGGGSAVTKGYVALVGGGSLDPEEGSITLPLRKDLDNPPKQVRGAPHGRANLMNVSGRIGVGGTKQKLSGLMG